MIANHFETIFNVPYPSLERHNQMYMNVQSAIFEDQNESYNSILTLDELQYSLGLLKNSSPGNDRVHNLFLKNSPADVKEYMLQLFNLSWRSETVPQNWLQSLIIPICKPDKDPLDIKSYRPISLLSCLSKLMERIVSHRLE